ncbi:hypothetical protein BJX64DRAFT_269017 [Aspergillus heterothallicus]
MEKETHPFLAPHSASLFHPSLVTNRSTPYCSPQTLYPFTYGWFRSASALHSRIRGETASAPRAVRCVSRLWRCGGARYHPNTLFRLGSEVYVFGSAGSRVTWPVVAVAGGDCGGGGGIFLEAFLFLFVLWLLESNQSRVVSTGRRGECGQTRK